MYFPSPLDCSDRTGTGVFNATERGWQMHIPTLYHTIHTHDHLSTFCVMPSAQADYQMIDKGHSMKSSAHLDYTSRQNLYHLMMRAVSTFHFFPMNRTRMKWERNRRVREKNISEKIGHTVYVSYTVYSVVHCIEFDTWIRDSRKNRPDCYTLHALSSCKYTGWILSSISNDYSFYW